LEVVQRKVNAKRQVFIEDMQARKDTLYEMEQYRESIKPWDMKMDHFKLQMVKDKR
jgi:hypothetical protein